MSRAVSLAAVPAAVAFDFDGTLVRSNTIKRACFHEAAAGLTGAAEVLDDLFARGFRGDRHAVFAEVVRRLGGGGGADLPNLPDPSDLAAAYGRSVHERIAAAPEVPGARDALERLKAAGGRLFLISATPQAPLEAVVAARDLAAYFDEVLGAPTPKEAHLSRIMEAGRLTPAEIVMVGDGRDDQEAAARIGCRFIAVTAEPREPLAGVETAIPDLRPLPRLLGLDAAVAAGPAGGAR